MLAGTSADALLEVEHQVSCIVVQKMDEPGKIDVGLARSRETVRKIIIDAARRLTEVDEVLRGRARDSPGRIQRRVEGLHWGVIQDGLRHLQLFCAHTFSHTAHRRHHACRASPASAPRW
eukprot:6188126-Pleurochrysis_carterae.AAC.5